jgi:hypothetical protein
MDDYLRRLERQAASGDYVSRQQWKAALARAGLPDPDEEALKAPLTEWEESQKHYDDLAWQRTTAGRMGWDWEPRSGCGKAHHVWGHRGWNNRNSKRKTIRTHRNGSRKNHRLRAEAPDEEIKNEAPHERRRKKRLGGKEHRCRCDWVQDQRTGRWRVVYRYGVPDLDE